MKKRKKQVAVVHCFGASHLENGSLACRYGCKQCGLCEAACRLQAISFPENRGAALVSRELCVGCGLCVKACPQNLIRLEPAENTIQPLCSNQEAGKDARKECDTSCIGCGICEKNCPSDAIHIIDCCAVIDPGKCIACGMCAVKCPRGVIRDANGIITAV
jgi:electron transport complex protein RnfB